MSDMHDVLSRFHRTLVDEIRGRRPEYLDGPFTVAEIYQNLVPYRSHRDRIGVEMNGDYEDALLRLLAGEGEFLVIESDPALRALRDELEAQNPNTGLYREFAAVDVHLNPTKLEGNGSAAPDPGAQLEPEVSVDELAPASDAEEVAGGEGSEEAEPEGEAAEPEAPHTPETCPWCRGVLPQRANLNYCPFCGTDVHVVPCPSCGEELEPEWRFCIACGAETAS